MGGEGSGWFASAGHVSHKVKEEWKIRIKNVTQEEILAEELNIREVKSKLPKEVIEYENSFGDYGSEKLQSTALYHYTGTHYERLNFFLRKGVDVDDYPTKDMRWEIPELDKAINNAPPVPKGIELWRGVGQESGSNLSKVKIGDVIKDNAFQSHTLSLPLAARFATGFGHEHSNAPFTQKTIIRAVTDGKVKGIYVNRLKEHEILIPRGTQWKVVSVDKIIIPRPVIPMGIGYKPQKGLDITYNIISVEPV